MGASEEAGRRPSAGAEAAQILVVEDDPALARFLTRALGRHWTVRAVGDGEEALAAIAAKPVDLLISDVMLPRMDGIDLVRRLRRSPSTRDLPVLLLTARTELSVRLEGFEAGADDFLVKPFATSELLARVRVHLSLRAARRELACRAQALEARVEAQVRDLKWQQAELVRANRELQDLITIVSHDLKSPLVSVQGFADLLVAGLEDGPETLRHAAERIAYNARWMHALLERLLAFARVRAGTPEEGRVDLEQVVDGVRERLADLLLSEGASLRVAGCLPAVRGDAFRIGEAVANVIENALRHRDARRAPEIEVFASCGEGWADLVVRDNGPGIPEEARERVFQPTIRLDGGAGRGTGLGLYIVRRVTEDLGGQAWIESRAGEGTTVHMKLPLWEEARP